MGCPAWIRTTINSSKGCCPTIRRQGTINGKFSLNCYVFLPLDPLDSLDACRREAGDRAMMVPSEGLEPPHLAAYAPQAYVSANSTTTACLYFTLIWV